jgi:hypothetical protein
MTQFNEAIVRYHRILESDAFRDLAWADTLQEQMRQHHLLSGAHRISPVLRPHFVTQRQYSNMVRATESLHCAIDRMERLTLSSPALMSRMAMLPAEKMLAAVDPGYSYLSVTSLLDTHLNNGTLHVVGAPDDAPAEVVSADLLNNLFYEAEPVVEFRRKTPLSKTGSGTAALLQSLLQAYKDFGGTNRPNIAVLEFRNPFQSGSGGETELLTELFRKAGYAAEVVSPDQLEYRSGVLRRGQFEIHVIYRRVKVSEFLMRFDLNHPLVRAYRDRAVCVVNSFRSELSRKKAIFDLLTDEAVTSSFPAAEKKAIREFVPWTRVVGANHTTYRDESIDLPAFIQSNREKLVLKPNDEDGEQQTFVGAELDESGWERALKSAMRSSYVVQETSEPVTSTFPLHRYGSVEMKEMLVDVHPHAFLGKVNGCSAYLTPAGNNGFSTVSGLAPTFILSSR